jgi:hypothetical protein
VFGKEQQLMSRLTNEIINAAIIGFEEQKRGIDIQIADLRAMLTSGSHESTPASSAKGGKKRMSAAGRKAIAEAQRKRWAESRGEADGTAPRKAKRKLSAAGKAAIVAALKKRWAAKKAGKT